VETDSPDRRIPRLTFGAYRLEIFPLKRETSQKSPVSNEVYEAMVRSSAMESVQVQELLIFATEGIAGSEVRSECGLHCRAINRI
jgi:hypothetical protein